MPVESEYSHKLFCSYKSVKGPVWPVVQTWHYPWYNNAQKGKSMLGEELEQQPEAWSPVLVSFSQVKSAVS